MVLKLRIRKGVQRFWRLLDEEGVGIFQTVVYVHVIAAGLYLLIAAKGTVPQSVDDAMGTAFNALWLWLCVGASVALLGKWLTVHENTRYAGFVLQLAGDLFALTAFVTYVSATFYTTWWGKAVFAVFICAAIAECIVLLVIRDVRRIGQVEKQVRR